MAVLGEQQLRALQRAGYKVIRPGCHSAVKLCLWTRHAIKTGEKRICYKQKFYPDLVKSHRCLQMTPGLPFCSLRCDFCWRDTSITYPNWRGAVDEPAAIADAAIAAQRSLLTGLGGVPHSDQHLAEAREPKNVAISLAGEPTLYPRLGELIAEFHRRRMTTFLVTNGCFPERLAALAPLPTQLYVSLCSNSEHMLQRVQKPVIASAWQRLNRTLELFPLLNTRRVVRLTMAKDLNMLGPEKYAALIAKTDCDFVEIKAAMPVGGARLRLPYSAMPSHTEIKAFAEKIAVAIGYSVADESADSRVVLLKG